MTKNICECGHDLRNHQGGICLVEKAAMMELKQCPCKKFKPCWIPKYSDKIAKKPQKENILVLNKNKSIGTIELDGALLMQPQNQDLKKGLLFNTQENKHYNPQNQSPQTKPSGLGNEKSSLNSSVDLDDVNHRLKGQRNLRDNTADAIFEMLHLLDEKVTQINNRFSRMAKELGYKT